MHQVSRMPRLQSPPYDSGILHNVAPLPSGARTSAGQILDGSNARRMTPLLPPDTIRSIPEALTFWANQTPDAVALLAPCREPATYRDLHEAVDSLANELRARGLYRQDGIALLLPEGPELCVLLLATIAAGIVVPLAWPNPATAYASILANPRD